MGLEDSELVGRTLAGEQTAFEELVNRYRDAVCGVAYHHIGNFDDVQDAAQESFVQAYLRLAQLRDPAKFGPWLRKITSNVCVSMLRGRRESPVESEVLDDQPAASSEDDHRAAVRTVVRDALAKLSDKVRLTVTLTYINGYSHDEVASFLDIPVNTVRSRLQHAKKQLREEMIAMVDDVLHEDKPDSALTERILDAMKMSSSQSFSCRLQSATDMLELIDAEGTRDPAALKKAVLEAVERSSGLDPEGAQRALKRFKEMTLEQVRDCIKTDLLLTKAQHTTGEDKRAAADEIMKHVECVSESALSPGTFLVLADMLDSVSRPDEAKTYCLKAMEAGKSAGDAALEGEAHMWLGARHMRTHKPREAREHFAQARDLLPPRDPHQPASWKDACASVLALLDEIGDEAAARLIRYSAACGILEVEGGAISFLEQPMIGGGPRIEDAPALNIGSVLMQVSLLGKMLARSPEPGMEWSGHFNSWYFAPLQTTALVKSMDESVTVPAGTFNNCLLIEYVTKETTPPDDAPEDGVRTGTSRRHFCGTRLAWFAPGAGLVQLQAHMDDGTEALIHLKEFSVADGAAYFPLAIGNTWTYGWADIPNDYIAKETYRITANEGNKWYPEHYHYVYKR